MDVEKPKVSDLSKRIDELIEVLKILSNDLKDISNSLRSLARDKVASISPEAEEVIKQLRTIDDVRKAFPEDLTSMLDFEKTDEYILIKPRQYLGSDNFARIASIVRDQLEGNYISAGKESHFRVSLRRT